MISKRDIVLLCATSALGAVLGAAGILTANSIHFYQFFMPESVYIACTGDYGHPGTLYGPLLEFLAGRSSRFDCADLPPDVTAASVGIFAKTHLYLMLATGWIWRVLSPTYASLWPLGALLYGAYVGGLFSLLRQFFNRIPAIVGTLMLGLSSTALFMLPTLRDFSKAPFIIWSLSLLVAASRSGDWKRQVGMAALAGVAAGIGYGFRTDLAIMVPIAIILLVVGIGPRQYLNRAVATSVFLLCFAFSGWPVLSIGNTSALGAMTMEGSSDPFYRYLELGPAAHSWGARYSDELTLSSIAADMQRELPTWQADEGAPVFGTSQAITRSTAYLTSRIDFAIGDLATRALKTASWILAYPAAFAPSRLPMDPGGAAMPLSVLTLPHTIAGTLWTVPLGLLGFAAFMLRESSLRPRQAISLTLAFGLLLGYTALQFSMRHAFQLEFFWIFGVLGLFFAIKDARSLVATLPRFLTIVTVLAILVAGTYTLAVWWQDRAMKQAIAELLDGTRETVATTTTNNDAVATWLVPVPEQYGAVVKGPPDSMVGKELPISQQWETIASVDRILISLGGPQCTAEQIPISINYAKRNEWQPLDEVRQVQLATSGGPTSLIFPAFYRATQNFESFSVPAQDAACIRSVERLLAPTRLPSVMTLTLPSNWQQSQMYFNLF